MEPVKLLDRLGDRTPLWHALYFGIGGLWSVVHKRSFQAISGPKVDYWLVRTVGGLLTVVGAVIAMAGVRDRITPEIRWLAVGASSVLTVIDVVYSVRKRVRRTYLFDAAANGVVIIGWLVRRSPSTQQKSGD
ncbi:MAG: hypothetical protein AB7G88_13230 [Thermomicrobiales bacterium]